MSALNWFGDALTVAGWVNSKDKAKFKDLLKYFQGSFQVTIGSFITGNYGTTLQSYYGPYITHCVDTRFGGIAGLLGTYLNPVDALTGTLLGIDGYVTWVYGPNITMNYGGPVSQIYRAPQYTKTAKGPSSGALDVGMVSSLFPPTPEPIAANPIDATGNAVASSDTAIVLAIDLISLALNLVTAILELAAKFAYTQYDSTPAQQGSPNMPDPSEDNYPLSGINLYLSLVPPRLMAIMYTLEMAGSWSNWGTKCGTIALGLLKDIGLVAVYTAVVSGGKHAVAKLKKAASAVADSINWLIVSILVLAGLVPPPVIL